MYMVDDELIDMILSRTDDRYIESYAILSPSMKVVELPVFPRLSFEYASTHKLRNIVSEVLGTTAIDSTETYRYNTAGIPRVSIDTSNQISVFYPYTIYKE